MAVNEASGDVYVVDRGANRVVRFNAAGEFQSEFNGSGLLSGEGKEAGGGTEPGEIKTGRFEAPESIAVDNSCALRKLSEPQCKEEDHSNGDVYVVDAGHRVVDKYSAVGEYLGQMTHAGLREFQNEGLDGVGVGPDGMVWVYLEAPVVEGFASSTPNEFTTEVPLPGLGGFGVPGFAVDSKGNFYGRLGIAFPPRIVKWSHSGQLLNEALDGEGSTAVAVEQTSDAALACKPTSLGVFSPEGAEVERLGEEGGEKHLTQCAGIGVNATTSFLYAADASGVVVVFGPAEPSPPRIEGESFENVGAHEASLAAEINPLSEEGEGPTEYHFQYGRCASATTCASSGYEASAPQPDGEIAADFEVHAVGVMLEGLDPNTTYHFRAVARNSHGQGEAGAEETFTTQGVGGGLVLPDNRGWELVSPPDKQGSLVEPIQESGVVQAAAVGDGITYLTNAPTEAQPRGYTNKVQVLSRRAPDAWSSRDIAIPHSGPTGLAFGPGAEYKFFDQELQSSAVQPFGQFISELSEEASESTAYLHDLGESCGSHCFRPLVTGKAGFANVPEGTVFGEEEGCIPRAGRTAKVACGPEFLGASDDLSHVVLKARTALVAGAAALGGVYEWSGGRLSAVSVLPGPGGEAVGESALGLGGGSQAARGAISSDGNRIAWNAKENLYERDMARLETVQLDEGEGCGECGSGGGRFQFGSPDGSRIFFTDANRLSEDAGKSGSDLYECTIAVNGGDELSCELTDLTPANGSESAEVQGGLLGASENGATIYFVAKGVLSEAPNWRDEKAQAGKLNLYARRNGGTEFIATLSGEDRHDWSETLLNQPTRASNNGRFLELMSQASLTGYDNRDRASGKPAAEVYIYDAQAKRLACASCEPSGARPSGVEYHKLEPGSGGLAGGGRDTWEQKGLVAANVPGWTAIASGIGQVKSRHQPRYLNDQGRLFFNSASPLVPQDTNGTEDVYEYEPPGVGNCSESSETYSARSGGCVSLISSGSSAQESAFMDASQSGDDVFFLTAARLTPLDTDVALDVYDAHVCSEAEPCITFSEVQSPPCDGEASCKASPTPQPSIFGAPASATVEGQGNLAPPAPKPPNVKTPAEIRAEKLAKALKACHAKKGKRKRKACERAARRKYGAKAKAKSHRPKRRAR